MSDITWTKIYNLKANAGNFQVLVSEHEGSAFYASCLWYEKDRVLKAPGQLGSLKFQLKQCYASTEEDALGKIEDWIKSKFGADYTLELR